MVRSYSKVKFGRVTVSVANMSTEDEWLQPKARYGVLTAVREVDMSLDKDVLYRTITIDGDLLNQLILPACLVERYYPPCTTMHVIKE